MKLKKRLAILLALSACFAFTACEETGTPEPAPAPAPAPAHEHSWATEWSKDNENHWHACTGTDCTETADKAAHTWNAGEITTQATASADGVKTYTCTACAQTKTESVPYVVSNEVTAEEWLAALSFANENNYKINSVATGMEQYVEYDGATVRMYGVSPMGDDIDQYCVKEGETYAMYSVSNIKIDKTTVPETAYINMKSCSLDTMFLFTAFQYDAISKTYKASEISYGSALRYANVEVAFENGKLVRMTYEYFYQGGAPFVTTTTVTYGDVQTIVLPTAELADETAWLAALNKATSMDVAKTVRVYTGTSAVEDKLACVYKITDTVTYEYNSADSGLERIIVMDGAENAFYQRSGVNATSVLGEWICSSSAEYCQTYFNIYETAQVEYIGAGVFANFTYNESTGAYSFGISGPYNSTTQCKAYCIGGELRALYWHGIRGMKEYEYFYVFDYNQPQIDIPVLMVTETEYASAYADLKDVTVAKSISFDNGPNRMLIEMDGVSMLIKDNEEGEYIYTTDGSNYYCYTRYYNDGEGDWNPWERQIVSDFEYAQGIQMYLQSMISFVAEPDYSALIYQPQGWYTWNDANYEYTYSFENGRFQAMRAEGDTDISFAVNYTTPEIEIPQV